MGYSSLPQCLVSKIAFKNYARVPATTAGSMDIGHNRTFFRKFTWAVPVAFSPAIYACRFEEGDVLYDSAAGYEQWKDGRPVCRYSLQVTYPPAMNTSAPQDADGELTGRQLLLANWVSDVEFTLIDWSTAEHRSIRTSQGRLFTLLHQGDLSVLEPDTPQPKPPVQIDSSPEALMEADGRCSDLYIEAKYPNRFLLAYDCTNPTQTAKSTIIYEALSSAFDVEIIDVEPPVQVDPDGTLISPVSCYRTFYVNSGQVESVRDILKECLWPKSPNQQDRKSVRAIFQATRGTSRRIPSLSNHGYFVPGRKRKVGAIQVHSFVHKPVYRYRLAHEKLPLLSKSVQSFLTSVITDCPNHIFVQQSKRASGKDRFGLEVTESVSHTTSHELIDWAKECRSYLKYKSRHENVAQYLLENDAKSICAELPIWTEPREISDFKDVFGESLPLTGHIDLVRRESDGSIGLWDYKPNAFKESRAHIQLLYYAFMFSFRTGLAMRKIMCGYFDEVDVFTFLPAAAYDSAKS
jgi:hypothetical protein